MRLAYLLVVAAACFGQEAPKKSYAFHGTVASVNAAANQLSAVNDPIPGGMGSMTMNYSVDDQGVLSRIHAGDRITAKMFEGETKLYGITVDPARVGGAMSLADLEKIALASNPTAAQADANFRAASAMARQSGLYPNPTVGYYGDEIRGGSYGGGKQGGYVSQTIITGGKLQAARKVAEFGAAESKTFADLQRRRIVNNVRMLFYQTLAAQRLVEVRQRLNGLAADVVQTGHQLANVGQADRPDILQAEVEQQQAGIRMRVAQQNLAACWRELAAVTGKADLAITHLDGDLEALPDLSYEQWLATTLTESPDIKIQEQRVAKAEAMLSQAKKATIPDIEINANLSQDNELLDSTHKPVGLTGGVQAGVRLPIFNRNQGAVTAAREEIESARLDVARKKLQITRDLATVFREYEAARITVEQYKTEMLPRAEQAYQLYRANYQNMAGAYQQTLMSQRTLFQLEGEYVQALETAWQSALVIRGFGLMDGLAAPVQ